MSEISEETIAEIERELLKDGFIDRLVAHAFQKMRRHYWQGVLGGSAPGGNLSTTDPEAATAFFNKFEQATEADLQSLIDDLAFLEEQDDEGDGSRG